MKICIFRSTRDVIRAERLAREATIACRVIPIPRSISPLCGMALELDPGERGKLLPLLRHASITVESVDTEQFLCRTER